MTLGLPAEGGAGQLRRRGDPVVTERLLTNREIGGHIFLAEKTIKN